MKTICFLVMWIFAFGNIANAYTENPGDCSLLSVDCVRDQFDTGDNADNAGTWAPRKGAILFYGSSSSSLFQVFLYFDSDAVAFYQNNSWAALEIDMVFPDSGFGDIPKIDTESVSGPSGTNPLRDTIVTPPGEKPTRGITVTNSARINSGWNTFTFQLNDNIPSDTKITANIQLVANVSDSQFMSNLFAKNDDGWAYYQLYQWLVISNLGYNFSIGGEVFKYFTMSSFQQVTSEDLKISSSTIGAGLCWGSKELKTRAEKCDSSNFLSVISENEPPPETAHQDNAEDNVQQVPKEEMVNLLDSSQGSIDPIPTTPDTDPDIHINSLDIKLIGGGYSKEIQKTLYWGQSFQFEGRAEFENKSSAEAKDIDADYRITDSRSNFNEDATKIDEDGAFDINPGEREENTINPITVRVSEDGTKVYYSQGSMTKSFNIINGFSKVYIFADIEVNGDKDISSPSDHDEYGKIDLIVLRPPCQPSFTQTPTSGIRPLTVSFTNTSISNVSDCIYAWSFGDGGTTNVYNPSYVYNNSGTFTPKLTASSYSYSYSTTKSGNTISITNPIPPSMMITNPTGSDNWRSDNTKHITWNMYNFPTLGNVRIDYTLDSGNVWRNIDTVTPNDGSRYWDMCKSYTLDSPNSYIRICSIEYGVCATSAKFYIDHAKGCK